MDSGYREADRGHFDCYLIDRRFGIAVAYTDANVVRLTTNYTEADRKAVEEFAAKYELPVVWNRA